MRERLSLWLRSVLYALRGGFLIRPFLIALFFGTAGAVLSFAEEYAHELNAWVPEVLFPAHQDPQVALAILSGIAGSIMTVVSIVFAILLMTLTLASTQFSPRILVSFVRDRATQWTLGIFLGTFSYCMAALPAVRSLAAPVRAGAHGAGRDAARSALRRLADFLHQSHRAVDQRQPHRRSHRRRGRTRHRRTSCRIRAAPYERPEQAPPSREGRERVIVSGKSGYIRFVDVGVPGDCAKSFGVKSRFDRRVGHFVPAGVPLIRVVDGGRMTAGAGGSAAERDRLRPHANDAARRRIRIIQIVDIALKAISPAVNDPTTAIGSVDQLSRILIRFASRETPESILCDPPGIFRVHVPRIGFEGLLDSAFEQIRHYAKSDIAVSLRLLRAFDDMFVTGTSPMARQSLIERARRVVEGCERHLPENDVLPLRKRLSRLEARWRAQGGGGEIRASPS